MILKTDDLIWYGRFADIDGIRYFDYSASGFEFCMTGKKAVATIQSDPELFDDTTKCVLGVYVSEIPDGSAAERYTARSLWNDFPDDISARFILTQKETECTLFESADEKTVIIRVLKLSEVNFGCAGLKLLEIDGTQNNPKKNSCDCSGGKIGTGVNPPKIEIIGDSITCGYGIEGERAEDPFITKQERADKAYGFLTAKKLGADFHLVSWSGIGIISKYVEETVEEPDTTVVMPSVWPYTDKSLSLRRGLEPEVWDESRFSPDIVIVHLGTNDMSYVRKVEGRRKAFVSGLRQFLEAIHRRSPKAKICCCLGAMGQDLCDSVEEAAAQFSGDFKNVPVKTIRFPMQDERDGIGANWHPSARTHEKMAVMLADALRDWCSSAGAENQS